MLIILMLLLLAALLCRNGYCPEDNNYKLIALASAIVILSSLTPSGVCAMLSFGLVVSIVLVNLCEMDFNMEDYLFSKVAVKVFAKKRPAELDAEPGSYGGGFAELVLRAQLRNSYISRGKQILSVCRILLISLGFATLIVSLIKTFTFFGWWSILALPACTFAMLVIILQIYFKLYQSDIAEDIKV